MPVKRATILRWTGRGRFQDMESSIGYVLQAHGIRGVTSRLGGSLLVKGPEPLGVASVFQHMPGIAWIAAGFGAEGDGELAKASESLARAYLRKGDRFSVEPEATGGVLASDVGGAVTSRVLEAVKGSRSSDSPRVRFRAAVDGSKGAVGVEVRRGAGGVPTGRETASCLVSGGVHSSVVAWMAVLAGFRVRMVHSKVSEESLLAVARLYSELSNRADPRGMSLEVLEGESVEGGVLGYAGRRRQRLFAGFHAGKGTPPPGLRGTASHPLYLLPEEAFREDFRSLRVKAFEAEMDWGHPGPPGFTTRAFSGGPADVSDVVDGLRRRPS